MSLLLKQWTTGIAGGRSWSSYCTPQYLAVLAAMAVEPSDADKLAQARWLKKMIDGGYFAKAELLDIFATDIAGNSLINWKSPGTLDPSLISTPTFTSYRGYTGAAGRGINLNFNESSDATLVSQNNICVMTGIGSNVKEGKDDIGGLLTSRLTIRSRHTDDKSYFTLNAGSGISITNTDSIKHYAMSRNTATHIDVYLNKTKTNIASNSVAPPNIDLYACGLNYSTPEYCTKQLRYVFIFSYLSEAEVTDVMDITEEYLITYRTNLIDYDKYIASGDISTKAQVPLTTYDGSGETIHPSVVNCGAAWNGYQYWMANTPYPDDNNNLENPSIWASSDGSTWVVPEGVTNPVVAKPDGAYNADPDLFYNSEDNKLYLLWKVAGNIKIISSADGATWGDVKTVLTTQSDETECFSPSLVKIGSVFYIYYNRYLTAASTTTTRRVSCNTIDGTYGNREDVVLPGFTGFIWWHIGAINRGGVIYLAASKSGTSGGWGSEVYVFKGADGINFTRSNYATLYVTGLAWETRYYRPCLSLVGSDIIMYYGADAGVSGYGIGKIKVNLY